MNAVGLAGVARLLRAHDDEDGQEFAAALERYLAGDHATLDEALELRPAPGQRSLQTQAALARRDEFLRRLASDHFPALSANAAAKAMHRTWSRYAASAWPRERVSPALPVHRINSPEFGFWQIMRMQDRVLSERTIRSILATS